VNRLEQRPSALACSLSAQRPWLRLPCTTPTIPHGLHLRIGSTCETTWSMCMGNERTTSTISGLTWTERSDDADTRKSDTEPYTLPRCPLQADSQPRCRATIGKSSARRQVHQGRPRPVLHSFTSCATLAPDPHPRLRRLLHIPYGMMNTGIHDRDRVYGADFATRIVGLGIQSIRTPVRSPLADSFAERFVGTARRECLDHLLLFGRRHLERVLSEFLKHYNQARPHQGLGQRPPCRPTDVTPSTDGQVERRHRLGGLLHEDSRPA
jgi:Integrase core domain